jgi:hypothetical protein
MTSHEGPTILWNMLKGKKVKTNDGKDVGDIKEISLNFLRLEKGTISKDKFWIPKYIADAFDGKVLWLLVGEEELKGKYFYGSEPPADQYSKDFEEFKTTSYGQKITFLPDSNQNVRVIQEKTTGVETTADKESGYKNIRDLE